MLVKKITMFKEYIKEQENFDDGCESDGDELHVRAGDEDDIAHEQIWQNFGQEEVEEHAAIYYFPDYLLHLVCQKAQNWLTLTRFMNHNTDQISSQNA